MTGVRASLGRPVAVMEDLHARLEAEPGTEPLHTPDTGIQCFRIVPAGVGEERLDELQTMVYRRVLAGGERSLAITRLGETTALRLVSVSEVVTPDDAWATVTAAREEAARIVREWEEAAG
jgi:glutamate/tyrosine decarboxylase-like PLP-dependent enzyme